MEVMKVKELLDILENMSMDAPVFVCQKDENVFTEKLGVVDAMCLYSGKSDTEDVVLIWDY